MSKSQNVQEAATNRTQELLLEFLREREHNAAPPDCPVCGYSLRALTRPNCPECGHELVLTVGAARHPIGWLLAALAPGFFSGIAAFFLLIPIVISHIVNDPAPPLIMAVDLFGWCSGAFAIILAVKRTRFLALPRTRQRLFAIVIWLIHIAAFVAFLLTAMVVM